MQSLKLDVSHAQSYGMHIFDRQAFVEKSWKLYDYNHMTRVALVNALHEYQLSHHKCDSI